MLATQVLRFGHSPDPDDAFMFYGFATGAVQVRDYRVEHVLEDIESLNRRALTAELEMTAVSAHAYAHLADRYWVMRTGASVGRGYGPLVVAREDMPLEALAGKKVALPGAWTTAALVFGLLAPACETVQRPFDSILEDVAQGRADAGVIIHEGQLTFAEHGVRRVADLGQLWQAETALPLPLGLDVVRADLGRDLADEASRALRASIEYACAHEDDAVAYAMKFGRGLDRERCRRFVRMYVNDDTRDLGPDGERALRTLYTRGAERGLIPQIPDLTFVG
ncbi:MAG TPA: MqnA/MqnD/SBP family protein [Candidatus Eisenbacteria bacterium]|nr:MqnA/MqnD/SBP family protein [Candidatus Eisenbacteria bacterium]